MEQLMLIPPSNYLLWFTSFEQIISPYNCNIYRVISVLGI